MVTHILRFQLLDIFPSHAGFFLLIPGIYSRLNTSCPVREEGMVDTPKPTKSIQESSQLRRYYRVQIRTWTSFDPSRMELAEIAAEIDRGTAFLTAVEVSKVVDDLEGIDDPEVRKSFENIVAAERILQNLSDLPKALRERLSAALTEERNARSGVAA
jgi:hypothetical protein